MTPTLRPGQEIVATNSRRPEPGNLVVFESPQRPAFWLVKRLVDSSGYVLSDNQELGDNDSRTLGPIPMEGMYDVVERLDPDTFEEAVRFLAREDSALARIIDAHGIPDFWHRQPELRTLVLLILEQQVSLESGAAMYRRLAEATDEVTGPSILELGLDGMRSIGVTRQKAGYLLELAIRVGEGSFDPDSVASLPWEEARTELLDIKGIGPWTADAYLLSALGMPDAWPVGDRALQVGTAEVLGMSTEPDEEELEVLAEPWRPLRAVAARLIWHADLER